MTETRKFRHRRAIPASVTCRRGAYSGRYEIEHNGTHVGWVIKQQPYQDNPGKWLAYVTVPGRFEGRLTDVSDTRVEAICSVLFAAYNRYGILTREEYDAANDDSWYEPETVP